MIAFAQRALPAGLSSTVAEFDAQRVDKAMSHPNPQPHMHGFPVKGLSDNAFLDVSSIFTDAPYGRIRAISGERVCGSPRKPSALSPVCTPAATLLQLIYVSLRLNQRARRLSLEAAGALSLS